MRKTHGQAGFTLIEALVALAVTALLLSATGTALGLLSNASRRGAQTVERLDMLARGISALRQDLSRLQRFGVVSARQPRFIFEGRESQIRMLLAEPPIPGDPGTYVVTYRVVNRGQTSQLVRTRALFDAGEATTLEDTAEAAEVTVLEGPYQFRFAFQGPFIAGTRPDAWERRWARPDAMPLLVRLEILSATTGRPVAPDIVVRPVVDVETACLYRRTHLCTLGTGRLAIAEEQPPPKPGDRRDE